MNPAKTNQNWVITLGKLTNVTFSLKDTHLIGRELFKINKVKKTQPPTYKIEDINSEIIEGKYCEQ